MMKKTMSKEEIEREENEKELEKGIEGIEQMVKEIEEINEKLEKIEIEKEKEEREKEIIRNFKKELEEIDEMAKEYEEPISQEQYDSLLSFAMNHIRAYKHECLLPNSEKHILKNLLFKLPTQFSEDNLTMHSLLLDHMQFDEDNNLVNAELNFELREKGYKKG